MKRERSRDEAQVKFSRLGGRRPHFRLGWAAGISLLLLSAAAFAEEVRPQRAELSNAVGEGAASDDPWEKMNRGIFAFNEVSDVYVLVPVAKAWRWATPHLLHVAVRNFNGLILMPTTLFNNVLQLKGEHVMEDIGRIMVNVSFGLAGLIDVATLMGIPANDESFDQTLGYWGAPPGPYLVLPLFGPSSVRGGIGRLGDGAGTFYFTWLPVWATFLVRGVDIISWRSDHIEDIDLTRRESLDYYVFQRDAYFQLSQARVDEARGVSVTEPVDDVDLYFFEDGYEEDMDEDGDTRPGAEGEERVE